MVKEDALEVGGRDFREKWLARLSGQLAYHPR
jgi:hypothetical protein